MDALHYHGIVREDEDRVGQPGEVTQQWVADPVTTDPAMPDARRDQSTSDSHSRLVASSNPYAVARERKRGGQCRCETHGRGAAAHTDPAQPEDRLGHMVDDTQIKFAEAVINADPGDAGRESGHRSRGTHTRVAALANNPSRDGAGGGQCSEDTHDRHTSPAKVRKGRAKRSAVGQAVIATHSCFADSAHISNPAQPEGESDHLTADTPFSDVALATSIPRKRAGLARHGAFATQATNASEATQTPGDGEDESGHGMGDTHKSGAALVTNSEIALTGEGGAGHLSVETHWPRVDPATITAIRHHWRKRQAWHRAEKALTLQAKALCRGLTDGDKGAADTLYKAALGKGEHPEAAVALGFIMPLVEARDGIEVHRKAVEKHLVKLAKTLHVAPWIETVCGVGIASLAGIIGEAGDLSVYSNPGKLWKRMGVAPHQGRAYATWRSRGGLTGADWIEAGYSPVRRSVLWNIGACVMKAGGPLKEIYDARKVMEFAKCEVIAADPEQRKLFAKDGAYAPKLHAHNRAQRYVEKRFLLLLWKEWRRGLGVVEQSEVGEGTVRGVAL